MNRSGSSSLVSSSGPSSPNAFADLAAPRGLCSEHSPSRGIDGLESLKESCSVASTFPQTPGLDQDLGSVGILLENSGDMDEGQEMNFNNLYTSVETKAATNEFSFSSQAIGDGDSGELTPVSVSSEFEYHQQYSEVNTSQEHLSGKANPISRGSNYYEELNEEVIKRKLDNNISRLEDGEEVDGEKTITTIPLPHRESIVGFFTKTYSKLSDKTDK